MSRIREDNSWGTESEIGFIKKLGSHRKRTESSLVKDLIEGYIKAASKRNNWGAIDRHKVLTAAKEELQRLA